jgi:hypothetical protein
VADSKQIEALKRTYGEKYPDPNFWYYLQANPDAIPASNLMLGIGEETGTNILAGYAGKVVDRAYSQWLSTQGQGGLPYGKFTSPGTTPPNAIDPWVKYYETQYLTSLRTFLDNPDIVLQESDGSTVDKGALFNELYGYVREGGLTDPNLWVVFGDTDISPDVVMPDYAQYEGFAKQNMQTIQLPYTMGGGTVKVLGSQFYYPNEEKMPLSWQNYYATGLMGQIETAQKAQEASREAYTATANMRAEEAAKQRQYNEWVQDKDWINLPKFSLGGERNTGDPTAITVANNAEEARSRGFANYIPTEVYGSAGFQQLYNANLKNLLEIAAFNDIGVKGIDRTVAEAGPYNSVGVIWDAQSAMAQDKLRREALLQTVTGAGGATTAAASNTNLPMAGRAAAATGDKVSYTGGGIESAGVLVPGRNPGMESQVLPQGEAETYMAAKNARDTRAARANTQRKLNRQRLIAERKNAIRQYGIAALGANAPSGRGERGGHEGSKVLENYVNLHYPISTGKTVNAKEVVPGGMAPDWLSTYIPALTEHVYLGQPMENLTGQQIAQMKPSEKSYLQMYADMSNALFPTMSTPTSGDIFTSYQAGTSRATAPGIVPRRKQWA